MSVCLSVCPSVCLSVCLPVGRSVSRSVCLGSGLSKLRASLHESFRPGMTFVAGWLSSRDEFISVSGHFLVAVYMMIHEFLFHRYWNLSTKITVNKIRTDFKGSQSGARTTKFHCEKISFVQSATRTTKFHWWWMNVLKETSSDSRCTQKNARFEKWPREGLLLFAQLKNSF